MKIKKIHSKYFILFDGIIIAVSLISAFIIRSSFSFFLFSDLQLTLSLPYVILFRILTNIFFEHYSRSSMNYHVSDIISFYIHNSIPSLLFLMIRFFSPLLIFKMPISMIFTEYFFSITWMVLARIAFQSIFKKRKQLNSRRKCQALLLLDEVIEKIDINIESIATEYNLEIIGILSPSYLYWNTDIKSIRIMGGYELLKDVIKPYQGNLFIVIDKEIPIQKRLQLYEECYNLGLTILYYNKGNISFPTISKLIDQKTQIMDYLSEDLIRIISNMVFTLNGDQAELAGLFKDRVLEEKIVNPQNIYTFRISEMKEISSRNIIDFSLFDIRDSMRKTSQSWEAIRHYITIIQQTKKNTIIHLLIVPVSIVTSASIPWDIFAIPNTSILIIENILYNKTDYVDVDSYIDYPGPVIASFFKTLHIINNLNINGIFYFRSTEALKVEDINRVKRALVFNQPRFADNPSKNKVKIDQLLQLFPTEYTGLYACKKT